jgi:hypothetical protein
VRILAKQFLVLIAGMITLTACDVMNALIQWGEDEMLEGDTATYRSERFNYELDYPADWFLVDDDSLIMLMSFELGTLPSAEVIPPEHTKIDIVPSGGVRTISFNDFVIEKMVTMDCIVSEPTMFVLDNGGQAVEIVLYSDMGGTYSVTYADLEGRYFRFLAFGNLSPIQDIVHSLRVITPSGEYEQQEVFDGVELEALEDLDCYRVAR